MKVITGVGVAASALALKLGWETTQVIRAAKKYCLHSDNHWAIPSLVTEHNYLLKHIFCRLPSCTSQIAGIGVALAATAACGYGAYCCFKKKRQVTVPVQVKPPPRPGNLKDFIPDWW